MAIKKRELFSIPLREEPILYCANLVQEGMPVMSWRTWEGPTHRLVLGPQRVVKLREGDQILSQPRRDGTFDIYGYRARVEH